MAAREAELDEEIDVDEELLEDQAPGNSSNVMLIAADSYENLSIDNLEIEELQRKKKSHIHEIVRQGSVDCDSSSGGESVAHVNNVDVNDRVVPTSSDESGDQADVRI